MQGRATSPLSPLTDLYEPDKELINFCQQHIIEVLYRLNINDYYLNIKKLEDYLLFSRKEKCLRAFIIFNDSSGISSIVYFTIISLFTGLLVPWIGFIATLLTASVVAFEFSRKNIEEQEKYQTEINEYKELLHTTAKELAIYLHTFPIKNFKTNCFFSSETRNSSAKNAEIKGENNLSAERQTIIGSSSGSLMKEESEEAREIKINESRLDDKQWNRIQDRENITLIISNAYKEVNEVKDHQVEKKLKGSSGKIRFFMTVLTSFGPVFTLVKLILGSTSVSMLAPLGILIIGVIITTYALPIAIAQRKINKTKETYSEELYLRKEELKNIAEKTRFSLPKNSIFSPKAGDKLLPRSASAPALSISALRTINLL